MSYFIGIDWGKKQVGIALADDENNIASGLKEVNTENFFEYLEKIKKDFEIKKIILGISEQENFSDNKKAILEFAKKIKQDYGFGVEFFNEDFSTKLAKQNNLWKKKGQRKKDNVESARIILQDWLDRKKQL